MKIIIKASFIIITILFLTIVLINYNKKNRSAEQIYLLKTDYVLNQNIDSEVFVDLFSDNDKLKFIDNELFTYHLTDELEYTLIPLEYKTFTRTKNQEGFYHFQLSFIISPLCIKADIENLYIVITSDKTIYKGFLGSFSMDNQLSNDMIIGYNSLGGEFTHYPYPHLNIINIEFFTKVDDLIIEEIISGNNISISYSELALNKKITLKIKSNNYLDNIYLLVKTNRGNYIIGNFYYGTISIDYETFQLALSVLEEEKNVKN